MLNYAQGINSKYNPPSFYLVQLYLVPTPDDKNSSHCYLHLLCAKHCPKGFRYINFLISITTPQSSYYYYPQYIDEETKSLHLKVTQLVCGKPRIINAGYLVPEPGILMLILFSFFHGDNYISYLPTPFILFIFFIGDTMGSAYVFFG